MTINYEEIFHKIYNYITTNKMKTLLSSGVTLLGIALLLSPTPAGTAIFDSNLYLLLLIICFGIPICYYTISKVLTVLGIKRLIKKKFMKVCVLGLIVGLSGCTGTSPEYEIHKDTRRQDQQEIKANENQLPPEPYRPPSSIRYRNRHVPGNVCIID
jgi:hypothetical protein